MNFLEKHFFGGKPGETTPSVEAATNNEDLDTGNNDTPSNTDARIPTGFRMSSFVREKHGNEIHSVAWSTDVFYDGQNENDNAPINDDSSPTTSPKLLQQRQVRYMASCGGNHVALYEVEIPQDDEDESNNNKSSASSPLVLRQAYVDRDLYEVFFTSCFGGRSFGQAFGYTPEKDDDGNVIMDSNDEVNDTSNQGSSKWLRAMADTSTFDGPQLLCVAGFRGVIKVIDTVQQMLVMTLSGHCNDIYDLQFSPTDEWLLLSASKDESIRLWNVQKGACVAIFAGHEGHREAVISVAWHSFGDRFASGSGDNCIKLWNVGKGTAAHKALQASKTLESKAWDTSLDTPPMANTFKAAFEQLPYFSSNKLHHDYVDCVQFVGDLVLSKSVHNNIVLWKPSLKPPMIRGKPSHQRPPNDVIALAEFTSRKCDHWFIRFDTSSDGRLLAVGNRVGEIKVWDVDNGASKKNQLALLTHPQCTSTVRMVKFSPDNKCIVAACEDATIWKYDATYS